MPYGANRQINLNPTQGYMRRIILLTMRASPEQYLQIPRLHEAVQRIHGADETRRSVYLLCRTRTEQCRVGSRQSSIEASRSASSQVSRRRSNKFSSAMVSLVGSQASQAITAPPSQQPAQQPVQLLHCDAVDRNALLGHLTLALQQYHLPLVVPGLELLTLVDLALVRHQLLNG